MDQIRERIRPSTEGPCTVVGAGVKSCGLQFVCGEDLTGAESGATADMMNHGDATLFAHARADLEYLLKIAEAAERVLSDVSALLERENVYRSDFEDSALGVVCNLSRVIFPSEDS